jgi:hypothetical protein
MCFAAVVLFWGVSSSSGGVDTLFDLDITRMVQICFHGILLCLLLFFWVL